MFQLNAPYSLWKCNFPLDPHVRRWTGRELTLRCQFPFVLHLVRILVMNTDKIPELPRRVVVQTRLVPILKLSDAQGAHMPQLDVLGSKKGLFLN